VEKVGNEKQFNLISQWKPQSRPKVVGTLKPYRVTPFPPNQCWKITRFCNKKGKNHLIINIESGGRGELASRSNSFVRIADLIQLSPPLTIRSWVRRKKSWRRVRSF